VIKLPETASANDIYNSFSPSVIKGGLDSENTKESINKIPVLGNIAAGTPIEAIQNEITKVTPASFEPTIDYVVTKVPRFTFEKFPASPAILGTSMKSVGEAMAIGRNFKESLQKALVSLEVGFSGLDRIFYLSKKEIEKK